MISCIWYCKDKVDMDISLCIFYFDLLAGIINLTYIKTNPGQPVNVNCIVTSGSRPPSESDVEVLYLNDINGFDTGTLVNSRKRRNFLTVTYQTHPPNGNPVICRISVVESSKSYSAVASIIPEFYGK